MQQIRVYCPLGCTAIAWKNSLLCDYGQALGWHKCITLKCITLILWLWSEITWSICHLTVCWDAWGQQNGERCFPFLGQSINTQGWHWLQPSWVSDKYCSANDDHEGWLGLGKWGVEEIEEKGYRRGNLTASVTPEEGVDVWHPASRAVGNSGPN